MTMTARLPRYQDDDFEKSLLCPNGVRYGFGHEGEYEWQFFFGTFMIMRLLCRRMHGCRDTRTTILEETIQCLNDGRYGFGYGRECYCQSFSEHL